MKGNERDVAHIDPKHMPGVASTKNRKSKSTSGPSKGRGDEVGRPCRHK